MYLTNRVSYVQIYLVEFNILWAIKRFEHDQGYNCMVYKTDIVTMLFIPIYTTCDISWDSDVRLKVSSCSFL